jgi:hypothetical protein
MDILPLGITMSAAAYSGVTRDIYEKREFPRFPVMKRAICFRYGKQMSMRTIDISKGGLKLEANFDLSIGESINFAILTNGTRIRCKGRVLGIKDLKNKVHARLRFAPSPEMDFQKLSDYLDTLSRGKGLPFREAIISTLLILLAFTAYLIIRAYFVR